MPDSITEKFIESLNEYGEENYEDEIRNTIHLIRMKKMMIRCLLETIVIMKTRMMLF